MGHSLYVVVPHKSDWLVAALRKHYKSSKEVLGFKHHLHESTPVTNEGLIYKSNLHMREGVLLGFNYSKLDSPEYEYVWSTMSAIAKKYGLRCTFKDTKVPYLIHDGGTKWRVLDEYPNTKVSGRTPYVVYKEGELLQRKRSTRLIANLKRLFFNTLAFLKDPVVWMLKDAIKRRRCSSIHLLISNLELEQFNRIKGREMETDTATKYQMSWLTPNIPLHKLPSMGLEDIHSAVLWGKIAAIKKNEP